MKQAFPETEEFFTTRKTGIPIFVFGSNLAGRHGKGAAKYALEKCGAQYGIPVGLQGQSYAIPTKDETLRTLDLSVIQFYVEEFLTFARSHTEFEFYVTAIGTGLAGYRHIDIAPMFADAPVNCQLPVEWKFLHDR